MTLQMGLSTLHFQAVCDFCCDVVETYVQGCIDCEGGSAHTCGLARGSLAKNASGAALRAGGAMPTLRDTQSPEFPNILEACDNVLE